MTLAELHERIGWQLEGRLQHRNGMACDGPEWFDWSANSHSTPVLSDRADFYRRRPDPAPMPDEVWLDPNHEWMNGSRIAKEQQDSIRTVRYVRAGAVIPASQIEVRQSKGAWVEPHHTNEYRIKL